MDLLDYAANVFSQSGEDGIIARILEVLPTTDRWCVEFGAWDGQHLSNTCNLIDNGGYSAVLIEGSAQRTKELQARFAANPKVIGMNRFVGWSQASGLDHLLAGTDVPLDFDFLSIDVDGNDYHVWKAIERYTPKIVSVEFNPSIPTEVEFVQKADPDIAQGNSLLSLTKLGQSKGYALVCVTTYNAIFVRAEFFPLFGISNNSPATLRRDTSYITQLFVGYDGTLMLAGNPNMQWHDFPVAYQLRQLPKPLRIFSGNYQPWQWRLLRFYRRFCRFRYALLG